MSRSSGWLQDSLRCPETDREDLDKIGLFNTVCNIDCLPITDNLQSCPDDDLPWSLSPILLSYPTSVSECGQQSNDGNELDSKCIPGYLNPSDVGTQFSMDTSGSSSSASYHRVHPEDLAPPSTNADTSPPVVPAPTRGRGRPKRALLVPLDNSPKCSTKRSLMRLGRAIHNNSAKRSRNKVNTALEELWKQVPEDERLEYVGKRILPRTEKLQIMISYIRRLRRE